VNVILKKNDFVLLYKIKRNYYLAIDTFYKLCFDVLNATYSDSKDNFEKDMDKLISKNIDSIKKIESIKNDKKNLKKIDENIMVNIDNAIAELDTIIKINNDLRKYIISYQDTIFKSEIYSTFGLDNISNVIGKSSFAQDLNPFLEPLKLDSTKLTIIILIILWTFILSSSYYWLISIILKYTHYKTTESLYIVKRMQRVVRLIIILFGLNMIIDTYLGVGAMVDESSKFFDMGFVALFTYLIYGILNSIASLKIKTIRSKKSEYRSEVVNLVVKIINFIVILIGFLIILKLYGINLSTILSGLGIGSLAVAFALKDTLSNFFGSVSILLDDPFSQGDWISVGKLGEGTVIEIGLRSTTIRTFDNAMITIPNLQIANNSIKNWNKRLIGRRIKMYIGVTYESNFDDIKKAITDIKQMLITHPNIATKHTEYIDSQKSIKLLSKEDFRGVKRTLLVNLDSFGESSVNIMIYCFSRSVKWEDYLDVKEDVMFKIAEILKDNNLEFAYPSMSLYVNN
jgi:MscS family membrane protein